MRGSTSVFMAKPSQRIALSSSQDDDYKEIIVELGPEESPEEGHGDNMLIGQVLAQKVLNRGVVKSIITKAWGNLEGLKISDLGPNKFMFIFNSRADLQEVRNKEPWFILNHMLSLQEWRRQTVVSEVDFSLVPFWVQIHGLPLGAMTENNGTKIARKIREPLEVEEWRVEGCMLRSFVKVLVNVLKPLLTGCWVPRENMPRVWVVFKFEKL